MEKLTSFSRSVVIVMAEMTISNFCVWRAGMMPSQAVVTMSAFSPSFWATAAMRSMSKPVGLLVLSTNSNGANVVSLPTVRTPSCLTRSRSEEVAAGRQPERTRRQRTSATVKTAPHRDVRVLLMSDSPCCQDMKIRHDMHRVVTRGLFGCCLLYTSDAADEEDSVDL